MARKLIGVFGPPKPFSQMTDAERDAFADALADRVDLLLEASCREEEAGGTGPTGGPDGPPTS